VGVELKAGHPKDQRLKERLALDQRQAGGVPSVEMQKIESVIDELYIPFAVGGSLCVGESRQPSLIDAAEFAIDVSSLDIEISERCNRAWIFVGPVEPSPG
jgi:hypothetical protein